MASDESPPGAVRPATITDADAIGEIHVVAWQSAYAGQLPDDFLRGLSGRVRARMWADVLGGPERSGTVLVAETRCERALAGFVAFGPRREGVGEDVGEVYALYLHPRHWGRGFGRMLNDQAVADLTEAGYTSAMLWVLTSNDRARAFYTRAGWTCEGITKPYVDGAQALEPVTLETVRYRRRLPGPSGPGT